MKKGGKVAVVHKKHPPIFFLSSQIIKSYFKDMFLKGKADINLYKGGK
jgi:hypothetical protein